MTFERKYTPEQRIAAIRLVREIAAESGRQRGAVAAAASQLGLHPSIVAHWVAPKRAAEPRPARALRAGTALAGLLICGLCRRPMVSARMDTGEPAYGCPTRCARRGGIRAADIEPAVGRMILGHLPPAVRPELGPMTAEAAIGHAAIVLEHVVAGTGADQLRVRWRIRPNQRPAQAG